MLHSKAQRQWFATSIALVILALTFAPQVGAQTASFSGIGQMPGAMHGAGTFATELSGNGSTIVGYAWV
jgi:hypothetical protein